MAKRKTVGNKLGNISAWGIAQQNLDGSYELVYAGFNRDETRGHKREVFPGSDYKLVKISGVFAQYNK